MAYQVILDIDSEHARFLAKNNVAGYLAYLGICSKNDQFRAVCTIANGGVDCDSVVADYSAALSRMGDSLQSLSGKGDDSIGVSVGRCIDGSVVAGGSGVVKSSVANGQSFGFRCADSASCSNLSGCVSSCSEKDVSQESREACALGVSERTLENRARRHARRDRKRERKALGLARGDSVESLKIPEWRRQPLEGRMVPVASGGFFSALAESKRESLRESRAQMLEAKNLLEAARAKQQLESLNSGVISPVRQARELKAQQQLEVMKAKDLELEKKRINTRMLRDAECDKVKIEQSFAKLAVTGNVPHVGGSVKTVVSGATGSLSSGTISPNSSISMKEIHDMMEKLAFLEKSHEEHQEFARHVKTLHPLIYDTLAPKEREMGKSFPPETEYEPTEGGGYPEHAWELEENLGMFDLEPDNKFRRRPDPDDTSGLIEYHKRRFHQFGIPVPYKSELSFIADNHLGR